MHLYHHDYCCHGSQAGAKEDAKSIRPDVPHSVSYGYCLAENWLSFPTGLIFYNMEEIS